MARPDLMCIGCGKSPDQLDEYVEPAADQPDDYRDAADYCWQEEGTLNRENGHFLCTVCYVEAGAPSSPHGWTAP
jgi:hypothetical protein